MTAEAEPRRETLSRGALLDRFEIVDRLGAGGMGQVYRAQDARLGREVAIKVLPTEVSRDPDRLQRFQNEARSASGLNHPNIVTIHDTGTTDGVSWIAMELVEGQTLRALVSGGAMSAKRLLGISAQVAEGLAAAHQAGIVHRDLKPENVMVTKDGRVKILDFGLACWRPLDAAGRERAAASQHPMVERNSSAAPTVDGSFTSPGLVLGTVGYMSPEQASGHAVDYRSDQFSFGSMLYEMCTGKRAFDGKTAVDTLSAILNQEPEPLAAAAPTSPAPLRWIAERCLAKEPQRRYASTDDLARELENLRDRLTEASVAGSAEVPAAEPRRARWITAVLVAAGLAIAALLFMAGRSSSKLPPPPTFRRLTFGREPIRNARFSPDGSTVVLAAGIVPRLYSVRVENPQVRALNLPSAFLSSVSPSGDLAILVRPSGIEGTLAHVPMEGGTPRELLENVFFADWAPDGRTLAVVRAAEKWYVQFPIGTTVFQTSGWIIDGVRVSPKGDRVAFWDNPIEDRCSLVTADRQGGVRVLSADWKRCGEFAWAPDGSEIWFAAGRSSDEDLDIRAVTLEAKERLIYRSPMWLTLYDIDRNGRVLAARTHWSRVIRGMRPGDAVERDMTSIITSMSAHLSNDGRALLLSEIGGANSVVALHRSGDLAPVRLGQGLAVALSDDGKWVLACRPSPAPAQLWLYPTGAGEARQVTNDSINHLSYGRFFPDGKRILFTGSEPGGALRWFTQDISAAGTKARALAMEPLSLVLDPISPDGNTIIGSNDKGWALYPADGGEPTQIPGAITDDEYPVQWTADGRGVYVRDGWGGNTATVKVRIIDISTGSSRPWKEIVPPGPTGGMRLDVARDGKSYVYMYELSSTDLYLAEGLK